ncbi:UDP-N-acetylmuramoyl-L-alanyl-D-glutamate--2,6-diaminopimelate ligase [Ornithinibacillus sp. 4-3]|uniref:UDP-N-acetylmuramoyl-L-alanyl-D-glutamate--2,6-diaminopimelate ligase n=1 Tax=Ornithinibacillus sp. 4-3 TaxID=3231488 RepID=A0AB39HQ43_9BACI
MKLDKLLEILPFFSAKNPIEDIEINNVEMDHRNIKKGDLFVCIKGFTVDGHDFIEPAIENGARAIIAEKEVNTSVPVIVVSDTTRALSLLANQFYDYPTNKLQLVGITGTNGKTTITYLLEAILNKANQKTGVIGTIQTKIGTDTYPVKNTTPDSLQLQKTFYQMVQANVDTAIMEVSSHALDLGRVYGCDYDIAIFTNLSQDHLDYHEDMKDYLRAKSMLFAQLGNGYDKAKKKFAIVNEDDVHSAILKKSTAQPVLTYGCKNTADIMAKNISLEITHTTFTLETPVGTVEIKTPLIGMFNVYNMLAAIAASLAMNIPLETIKAALENIPGVDGRFEQVKAGQDYAVIVDYAHTPDSLENVLQTITEFVKGKIYVVVGCGGDRDRTKRPLMANIAVQYADKALLTSDNPRTEDPESILEDMVAGIKKDNYEVIVQRKEAIARAVEIASEGDIILIAGKGHETYQEINNVRYDFDDRIVAHEAIRAKEN